MKYLTLASLLFFHSAFADTISTDLIFGDSYTGYFEVNSNNQDDNLTVTGYTQPDLNQKIAGPTLLPIGCMEGGGGDCTVGTPYINQQTDNAGNVFYLVNNQRKTRVWILQPVNTKKMPMDIHLGSGSSFLLEADDAALTDTSKIDKVPALDSQQLSAVRAMNQAINPEIGQIEILLQDNNANINIPIWISNQKPGSANSNLLNLAVLSPIDSRIQLTVLRKKGNYLLVASNTIVDFIPTRHQSPSGDISIFWIDASKLVTHYSPTIVPAENSVSSISSNPLIVTGNHVVTQIKSFNGKAYAFIEKSVTLLDPDSFNMETKEFGTKEFTIPIGWKKIRDEKGRLRIWFQQDSGC